MLLSVTTPFFGTQSRALLRTYVATSLDLASQPYFSPCAHARIIKFPAHLIIRACAHGEKYGWLARLLRSYMYKDRAVFTVESS